MEQTVSRFRRITRILLILFIIFLTLFSFDVFEMEGSIWLKLGAFVLHSVPSLILVVVMLIAWRWPVTGGILLLGCVLAFGIFSRVRSGADFTPWQFVNPVFIFPTILGVLLIITPAVEHHLRRPGTPSA